MKKAIPFIIIGLLVVGAIVIYYQQSRLKDSQKDNRLAFLISQHPLPTRETDSLSLLNFLVGKNIPGWGEINAYEIKNIKAQVNTQPSQGSYLVFSGSRWYCAYNYDFDPEANNNIYDIISFQVKLTKSGSSAMSVLYTECNHAFNNSSQQWDTNFEIKPNEVRAFDGTKDF